MLVGIGWLLGIPIESAAPNKSGRLKWAGGEGFAYQYANLLFRRRRFADVFDSIQTNKSGPRSYRKININIFTYILIRAGVRACTYIVRAYGWRNDVSRNDTLRRSVARSRLLRRRKCHVIIAQHWPIYRRNKLPAPVRRETDSVRLIKMYNTQRAQRVRGNVKNLSSYTYIHA